LERDQEGQIEIIVCIVSQTDTPHAIQKFRPLNLAKDI
jgi:hypothetical protein